MKVSWSDRRSTLRHNFKVPISIRKWKSGLPDQRGESENLSERGIFFATNTVFPIGSMVEILVNMPEVITGEPTTEWRCSGQVVRVETVDFPRGKLGVGVQFDCYEISRPILDEEV